MLTCLKATNWDAAHLSCPFKETAVKFQRPWRGVRSVWECNSFRRNIPSNARVISGGPSHGRCSPRTSCPVRETSLAGIKGDSFQTECLNKQPVPVCISAALSSAAAPAPRARPETFCAGGGPAPRREAMQTSNPTDIGRGFCVLRVCCVLCISCLLVCPPFLARWELLAPSCRRM